MEGLLKREETQAWREKAHSFILVLKPTPDDLATQNNPGRSMNPYPTNMTLRAPQRYRTRVAVIRADFLEKVGFEAGLDM